MDQEDLWGCMAAQWDLDPMVTPEWVVLWVQMVQWAPWAQTQETWDQEDLT